MCAPCSPAALPTGVAVADRRRGVPRITSSANDCAPRGPGGASRARCRRARRYLRSYLSLVERVWPNRGVAAAARGVGVRGHAARILRRRAPRAAGPKLVRSSERRRLSGFDRVEIEDLSLPSAVLEIDIFNVAPGGGSGGAYSHDGEEAIYVLDGELDIWLDDTEHYHIEAGDTLYFHSPQQHRWMNQSSDTTRLFWVNTPPTF